jgi:hypothetical protein
MIHLQLPCQWFATSVVNNSSDLHVFSLSNSGASHKNVTSLCCQAIQGNLPGSGNNDVIGILLPCVILYYHKR